MEPRTSSRDQILRLRAARAPWRAGPPDPPPICSTCLQPVGPLWHTRAGPIVGLCAGCGELTLWRELEGRVTLLERQTPAPRPVPGPIVAPV
jgi:hypothetical protein